MVESKYYCDFCGEEILQKQDKTVPSICMEDRHCLYHYDLCDSCFFELWESVMVMRNKKSEKKTEVTK